MPSQKIFKIFVLTVLLQLYSQLVEGGGGNTKDKNINKHHQHQVAHAQPSNVNAQQEDNNDDTPEYSPMGHPHILREPQNIRMQNAPGGASYFNVQPSAFFNVDTPRKSKQIVKIKLR
uniref:Uncharacterized protein n=1 Tax=Meloidogyne enterolobii TaxID=390850 RepID=A0A6V7V295_MELEN|nr:unnamed protein product [Meloidogyne enterolobii]